jgi:hypothetical protein
MERNNPRLLVDDKRRLHSSLIAMVDRLLFLNKFPVDMHDFALSLEPPETEAALRHLEEHTPHVINRTQHQYFRYNGYRFRLHMYPEDVPGYGKEHIFHDTGTQYKVELVEGTRHYDAVSNWCKKQLRLEEQILRCDVVINAIVNSCNTIGQYKRVSPELIAFLPDEYQQALKDYEKRSPYPAITVEPQEIDTTLSNLAFCSLQPKHKSEANHKQNCSWRWSRYHISPIPMSVDFAGHEARNINL